MLHQFNPFTEEFSSFILRLKYAEENMQRNCKSLTGESKARMSNQFLQELKGGISKFSSLTFPSNFKFSQGFF